jgi:hypothetical protein
MLTVVNGYFCYDSCQVAAARAGRDPHALPGTPSGQSASKDKADGLATQSDHKHKLGATGQSSSILDPGQTGLTNAVDTASAAGATNSDYQTGQGINLLV